jgi:Ser/Thr protein kinase RdoA (MazF antagonist)
MTFEPPSPASDPIVAPLETIDEVLALYGIRRTGAATHVAESVLNPNFRVETDAGVRFVRLFREKATPELIEAEYRLIDWVGARGIPVCAPLRSRSGGVFVTGPEGLAAVFPWLAATHFQRATLTAAQAAVLGDMQGRIQSVLRDYRDPVLEARPRSEVEWDTETTIAALSRVDDVIRYYPAPSEERLEVQRVLRIQLELLETRGAVRPQSDFDGLPEQIDHCDFHERNVMIGPDNTVLAVVDWERARLNPRAFHLLRALDFTGALFRGDTLTAHVRAYGRNVRLTPGEAAMAVEQWWQSTLHQSWLFTEVFIRGNGAPLRFLPQMEGRFALLQDPSSRAALAAAINAGASA